MIETFIPSEEALADLAHFDEALPEHLSNASEVLKKLNTYGAPATMAQIGGRYHGFVNGSFGSRRSGRQNARHRFGIRIPPCM